MDYTTLSSLKHYLGIPNTDTDWDAELSLAITAASSAINRATNRSFATQDTIATTRYFTAIRPGGLQPFLMPSTMFNYWFPFQSGFPDGIVPIDDLFLTNQLITDIQVTDHDTGASLTIDRLWPFNAAAQGMPYTAIYFAPSVSLPRGEGKINVLAKFSWATVPSAIANACLIQAARYFKRKDAPFGVAGSTAAGDVLELRNRLDPDVDIMLADFRRMWSVADGEPYSNGATY